MHLLLQRLWIGTFLFGLIQCKKDPINIRTLEVKKSVYFLTDSTILTDVRNIDFSGNGYLVSDNKRGQIIEFDSNLQIKRIYGSLGDSKGKLKGVTRFYTFNDTIFAISPGTKTIECFVEESQVSAHTIRIPETLVGTKLDFRFIVNQKHIVLSAPYSGKSVSLINRNGSFGGTFGDLNEFEFRGNQKSFETYIRNLKWFFESKDGNLVSVSEVSPEIEIFSNDRKLIRKFDVGFSSLVSERLDFVSKQPTQPGTTYALFRDAYLFNERLYLLCISGAQKSELQANKVLVFNLNDDEVEIIEELLLPGKWYSSICFDGYTMLAYEATKDELQLLTKQK